MAVAATASLMTTEELLALPEDGVDRWLIRGQLREKPMMVRNRFHSCLMARVAHLLVDWRDRQPEPRGEVLCGEAGCRLRRNPDTTVGIDAVYVPPELLARQSDVTTLIDGVPLLVVEILSPNDTQEQIHEMIREYLEAGVLIVWIIDPDDRTIRVYEQGKAPILLNVDQELSGEPYMPGFRVPVAQVFA